MFQEILSSFYSLPCISFDILLCKVIYIYICFFAVRLPSKNFSVTLQINRRKINPSNVYN